MICPRCEGKGELFFQGTTLPTRYRVWGVPDWCSDGVEDDRWVECDLCDGEGELNDERELEGLEV